MAQRAFTSRSAVLIMHAVFYVPSLTNSCRPKTHYSLWNLLHSRECSCGHTCYYAGWSSYRTVVVDVGEDDEGRLLGVRVSRWHVERAVDARVVV